LSEEALSPAAPALPAADDRGLLYGDGLFETLVCRGSRPLWLELHLERLAQGLDRLLIDVSLSRLEAAITGAVGDSADEWCVLRLTVTRGSGERGYAPPTTAEPGIYLQRSPLRRNPLHPSDPLRVSFSDMALSIQPRLAGIKHLNRLEQVLAAADAQRLGVDDVLLCTTDGDLHSSSRANLFIVEGDCLFTAPCDHSGIAGTRRRLILERLAPVLGLKTAVERLQPTRLAQADGAFLCNSVIGLQGIAAVDGRALAQSAVLERLQQAYEEEGRRCAEQH
jgi:aminodeoxychorismate lyase